MLIRRRAGGPAASCRKSPAPAVPLSPLFVCSFRHFRTSATRVARGVACSAQRSAGPASRILFAEAPSVSRATGASGDCELSTGILAAGPVRTTRAHLGARTRLRLLPDPQPLADLCDETVHALSLRRLTNHLASPASLPSALKSRERYRRGQAVSRDVVYSGPRRCSLKNRRRAHRPFVRLARNIVTNARDCRCLTEERQRPRSNAFVALLTAQSPRQCRPLRERRRAALAVGARSCGVQLVPHLVPFLVPLLSSSSATSLRFSVRGRRTSNSSTGLSHLLLGKVLC